MKNPRSDPARGASCSQGSGGASAAADEKGKSTRTADGRKQKKKKKNRASAPVSGSDSRHVADGEIARSKHQRKLSRSPSPAGNAQETSGETSALAAGKKSKRLYSRQKKKSKTRNPARRSCEVVDDAFAGEDSAMQLASQDAQAAGTSCEVVDDPFAREDSATQLARLDAQAAGTRLMVCHHPSEAKLVGGHAFPKEETNMLNQQQNDPNRSFLQPSHGSTPEEASEASLVVANAASTQTKIQISEKKSKIQSTPTSGDLGRIGRDGGNSDKIAHVMDHEQEPQPEGLDWDSNKLRMEIRFYLDQLDFGPPDDDNDDDDDKFWAEYEEPELTRLKEQLALHRIIAHEISEKRQPLDDAGLRKRYPPQILKEEGYFEEYEQSLEWYFYPEYCMYVGFQDYQRLVLRNKHEYHSWERYCKTNSTYEVDREFVKFYEKLGFETKCIEKCLTDRKLEWGRIQNLAFYQAAKIATCFENIDRPLLYFCFTEFTWSICFDHSFYKPRARLFFELWKRVAKQKMNFIDALKQIHEQRMCPSFSYEIECELGCSAESGSMKVDYDTYAARIEGEVQEDKVFLLTTEGIKKFVPKRKTYYDYVKKLHVSEEIRLIPPEIRS